MSYKKISNNNNLVDLINEFIPNYNKELWERAINFATGASELLYMLKVAKLKYWVLKRVNLSKRARGLFILIKDIIPEKLSLIKDLKDENLLLMNDKRENLIIAIEELCNAFIELKDEKKGIDIINDECIDSDEEDYIEVGKYFVENFIC
jgi:hypothetical protein